MPFAFNGISLLVAIPDLTEAQASLPRDLGGRGAKEGLSAAWWGFLRGSGKRERGGGGERTRPFSLFPLFLSLPLSRSPFRGRASASFPFPPFFSLVPPAPMLQPTIRELFFLLTFFSLKKNETEKTGARSFSLPLSQTSPIYILRAMIDTCEAVSESFRPPGRNN